MKSVNAFSFVIWKFVFGILEIQKEHTEVITFMNKQGIFFIGKIPDAYELQKVISQDWNILYYT